ncbi:ankyrin repeat domain-containing protein 27-like isoform X2 [Mya arenaria]|uniref:ankyrin repeat domain-containing protein 27-like isoform X2 n=1 Tax=Mya arenaria TaxID=6604 RepID=UPI0022E3C6D5|nr:ankyrin repeat domain-containing protein 27-like isoform X2 [Mya arenaria]
MSRYDEDLYDNPFFIYLEKQLKPLFDKAASNRWIVCIPRYAAVKDEKLSQSDGEDHILVPSPGSESAFSTVSKHTVTVQQGVIVLGNGFKHKKKVEILFEETFFNSSDESYRVLCVGELFNRDKIAENKDKDSVDYSRPPATYEECYKILWGITGSTRTKESLDKVLLTFCAEYQRFTGDITPSLVDLVTGQVTKSMQIVLKDQTIKRNIKQYDMYMASLKLSVEMYFMNAVHKHLFATITNCVRTTDANLNKMNRNLVDVRLEHLDVRPEYDQNLPAARKELSMLNQYSTPLGRLLCLKRVITALLRPIKGQENDGSLMITTDDLLPLLIYLVIKSPINNWTANLMYMKHFLLSRVTETDEFSFYLATTEAALDYIPSGNLTTNTKPTVPRREPGYTRQGSTGSLTSTKEKFFQYVQYGDEAAVKMMLKKPTSEADNILSKMCHPLCTCEKCAELQSKSSQNSGAVTPIVRDDMGRTALHLAAFYGQAGLIDILVKLRCLTDASDYLGCTPLHMATLKGHQNVILLLVHFGADISVADNEGNTPLHLCAKNGHEDCVKAILFLDILKSRLNVNAQNDMGDTPLHLAAKWGYEGIVNFLLESEADPRVRNRKRQTPLNVAQNPDIKKALQIVLDDPPPLIYRHPESTIKPVHYSKGTVTPNPKNTIPTLSPAPTPNGQDDQSPETPHGFEIVDVRDRSPVQLVDNSSKEMMSPRTPVVASLDQAENTRQVEKLFKAIAAKDIELVKYHFGWMDSDTSESPSPISRQATASDKMCHPLCQCDKCLDIQKHSNMNCVSINCQSKRGFAPLHTCVIENNLEVFTLLLKKGAFVNILTNKHITPLHLACHHDRPQMVQLLLQCGADVNLQDQYGELALHLACAKSSPNVVQLLIKKNSRLDVCNTNGNTPLHHTAIRGCFESTKLLLQNGARPDVVNKHNHSPLDVAKSEEVRQLLLKELETLPPISEKSDTKNEDIFNHGGLNTVHKGTLNKPADGGRHQSSDPKLLNQSSTTRCHSLHKSRTFDGGPVITPDRENLSLSIKTFDKQRKLKRSKTFDHSSPNIDNPELKLSLSIQHFDKVNSLRHVEITDKSRAMLEQLKLPLEIQHFETGTLKHVEPLDKSSPMYIYEISRDTSCYSDYCDTPMVEKTEEFQFKGDKFVDKCSNTDSDQSTVSKENITGESEVCETPDDTLFEHSRTGDHVDELQHGRAVTNSSELKNGGDDIDAFLKERDTTDKVLYEPISSINSSMDLPDEDIENCT